MSLSPFSHLASKANLPCPLAVCIDLNNPATLRTQPGLSLPPPALTNPGENKSHSLKPIKNEIIFLIKGRSFQMYILCSLDKLHQFTVSKMYKKKSTSPGSRLPATHKAACKEPRLVGTRPSRFHRGVVKT